MLKLAVMIAATAVMLGAAAPAMAKHHHHASAAVEPVAPTPTGALIGGPPVKQGAMCYTVRSADWGAGFLAPCAK